MAAEATKVGVKVEALVNDLGATRAPEMDVAGDLAETVSDREELDDVVFEFGIAACLDPPAVARSVFDVGGGRRDERAFSARSAAAHADADHVEARRTEAVLERCADRERCLKPVRLDIG